MKKYQLGFEIWGLLLFLIFMLPTGKMKRQSFRLFFLHFAISYMG